MRITNDNIQYGDRSIPWNEVKDLRQTGENLLIKLSNGKQVEINGIHRTVADEAFRIFNQKKSLE